MDSRPQTRTKHPSLSWFAARPSGTEDIYKLYAKSFRSEAHLHAIVTAVRELVYQTLTQKRNGKAGLTEGQLVGL